ncbi:hypothetical protein ACVXG8_05115 [Escherichia coli]
MALERQLDSEERALLIERSQTVIRQAAIFFAPGMPPGTRRRRWITHYSRTEQLSLPTPWRNTLPVWQPHSAVLLK